MTMVAQKINYRSLMSLFPLSTDTLHSRTNSSASVRRPYTRAYLQQRTTHSDQCTSYSSSSTLNKSFSEVRCTCYTFKMILKWLISAIDQSHEIYESVQLSSPVNGYGILNPSMRDFQILFLICSYIFIF